MCVNGCSTGKLSLECAVVHLYLFSKSCMLIPCLQAAAASRRLPQAYGIIMARHVTSYSSMQKDIHDGDDQGYTIFTFLCIQLCGCLSNR